MTDMYATAVRLSGSPEVAEDLVHDLFVNLRTKDFNMDHVKNPRAWLASILFRLFVDGWRKETRSPIKLFGSKQEEGQTIDAFPSQAAGPLQQLETTEQTQRLLHAMSRLGEDQRRIIIMHDVEGYTLPELQEMMKLPLGTLKSRLHRAREKLRNLLAQSSLMLDELTMRRLGAKI